MKKEKISGIYCIKNIMNGKVYIGQSKDISNRKCTHFRTLLKNKHKNFKLQGSYNKYGRDNFEFSILEETEILKLNERENYYINKYNCANSKFGYNIATEGKRLSEEWIKKLKYKRKNEEHFIKQFENCRSKCDNRIKINQYNLNGEYIKTIESIVKAGKELKISPQCVLAVLQFKRSQIKGYLYRYFRGEILNIEPFKSFRKKRVCLEYNNIILKFNSSKEAAEYLNTYRSTICLSLKSGKYKQYKIYSF